MKAAGLGGIPSEVWKKKFDDILFRLCNAINKPTQ